MKLTSWHYSSISILGILFGVLLFGSNIIGGLFFLSLFPASVWWGWTLHERHLIVQAKHEQAILDKYRTQKAGR